jgi:nanoRNase/pAp phosphatase (c-di-AMP/oligoRNAs hydrolase)
MNRPSGIFHRGNANRLSFFSFADGGGGHARVGAISFPPDREADARAAAQEIVAELRKTGTRE